MTDTQEIARIRAAGRILSDRSADACGVDREDNWTTYSEDFCADAKAAMSAVLAHIDTQAAEIFVLKADLKTALQMLAGWCIAVDESGTGWDDWDEHYKGAAYRDGPLRGQIDECIAAMKETP